MFWTIVIILFVIWLFSGEIAAFFRRTHRPSDSDAPVAPAPQFNASNIYSVIRHFAQLCYQGKKHTGWAYETMDTAYILINYSTSSPSVKLSCFGDCIKKWAEKNANGMPLEAVPTDNQVVYISSNLSGLDAAHPERLFEAFQAGHPDAVLHNISNKNSFISIEIHFT